MLMVYWLFAYGLNAVGGDFARQARVVLWFGIGAAVFMHLGDPIWYGFAWRQTLFEFVAEGDAPEGMPGQFYWITDHAHRLHD